MSYAANKLIAFETSAIKNNQYISSVRGKSLEGNNKKKKLKGLSASLFLAAMGIIFATFFGFGNIMPDGVSERLIEETDVQYADAVESKALVFQQAMYQGDVPSDTAKILEENGVEVGYITQGAFRKVYDLGTLAYDGEFIQSNRSNEELVLKMGDKIITANEFIDEIHSSPELYNAFTAATYGRAAYYYDDAAKKVFQKIGTNRNNYTTGAEFDEVMDKKVGEGSNININSVSYVKKTRKNERGEEEVYYEYEENGAAANSKNSAGDFINQVREKNPASSASESALFAANELRIADTISKEERSSLFFVTFMENISKMKAGDGNTAQVNEAMNFLYDSVETEVVDVKTGEVIKVSGSALEAPSLYAVLAGEKVDASLVENYSSDRVLKTVENQIGVSKSESVIQETVASSSRMNGSIGRFISSGIEKASAALLNIVEPTVSSSLVNNSYKTIQGIGAGEFLVEGAVNVGKSLAEESGATGGDMAAILDYGRLNAVILAMDAKVDRMKRSPFDITSKNTFLGSLVYRFAISVRRSKVSSILSGFSAILNTTKASVLSMLPTTYADGPTGYLSSFGDCEAYEMIGAVGSVHCSEIATFDTSTLKNIFTDPGFIKFVEENTILDNFGNRVIKNGSTLAKFILYNKERETPLGVMDGGILESLKNNSESVNFVSDILGMVETWLGSTEAEKRIASGAAFVNSSSNSDWQIYKYAQRYVSLARATATLKSYTNDKTAYQNIRFFEGKENPVVAFLKDYYASK